MKVQVFLQSEFVADVVVLEIEHDASGGALKEACLLAIPEQHRAEPLILLVEDIDEEDAAYLMEKFPDGLRVHLHRHKQLDVVVRYAGRDVRRTFRPSATVGRVKQWAARDLGISPSDAAELMLQVAGTSDRPDQDVHLGALVREGARSIVFDLVPAPRVQG